MNRVRLVYEEQKNPEDTWIELFSVEPKINEYIQDAWSKIQDMAIAYHKEKQKQKEKADDIACLWHG